MARAIAIVVYIALVITISSNMAFANPCGKGALMQQYYSERDMLQARAHSYYSNNLPIEAAKYYEMLQKLDAKLPYIWLRQEIQNFPLFENVSCLIAAMRRNSGQNLEYQPYTDGKLDLLLGEKKIRDRISKAELLSIARSMR
jgi:hypothetical protein